MSRFLDLVLEDHVTRAVHVFMCVLFNMKFHQPVSASSKAAVCRRVGSGEIPPQPAGSSLVTFKDSQRQP